MRTDDLIRDYRIRPALPSDLPRLPRIEDEAARIFDALGTPLLGEAGEASQGIPPAGFARAQAAGLLWVAATEAGEPVGFALVEIREPGAVHLRELDVLPEHGRRGLGRRLVQEVLAWARERGCAAVTLTTFRDVPWNAPWYERLGFRRLAPAELSPALREVFAEEAREGLLVERRIAMRWEPGALAPG
ncbi:MAG TPA: GNAT family N-acetyltransferase [Thermoanaerobaculia bacterium]|nr:GNAT family N-acetyltransferase [Thermoanaerobaculia bacterium]